MASTQAWTPTHSSKATQEGTPSGAAERQAAWRENGYFFIRGMIDLNRTRAVEQEIIDAIRAEPPTRHDRQPQVGVWLALSEVNPASGRPFDERIVKNRTSRAAVLHDLAAND
jgi:hypothetical protein